MKGVLFSLAVLSMFFLGMGCQTVPRHLVQQEVIIIYPPEYPITDPPDYYQPIPDPIPPVKSPKIRNPIPPRDKQSKISETGGSYGKRDPIKSGGNSGRIDTKTHPPVKKSGQNDRVQ